MKTTTTTREYDAQGRMVKETVVEQDVTPAPSMVCTCWQYGNIICPVHGQRMTQPLRITCGSTVTKANPKQIVWNGPLPSNVRIGC